MASSETPGNNNRDLDFGGITIKGADKSLLDTLKSDARARQDEHDKNMRRERAERSKAQAEPNVEATASDVIERGNRDNAELGNIVGETIKNAEGLESEARGTIVKESQEAAGEGERRAWKFRTEVKNLAEKESSEENNDVMELIESLKEVARTDFELDKNNMQKARELLNEYKRVEGKKDFESKNAESKIDRKQAKIDLQELKKHSSLYNVIRNKIENFDRESDRILNIEIMEIEKMTEAEVNSRLKEIEPVLAELESKSESLIKEGVFPQDKHEEIMKYREDLKAKKEEFESKAKVVKAEAGEEGQKDERAQKAPEMEKIENLDENGIDKKIEEIDLYIAENKIESKNNLTESEKEILAYKKILLRAKEDKSKKDEESEDGNEESKKLRIFLKKEATQSEKLIALRELSSIIGKDHKFSYETVETFRVDEIKDEFSKVHIKTGDGRELTVDIDFAKEKIHVQEKDKKEEAEIVKEPAATEKVAEAGEVDPKEVMRELRDAYRKRKELMKAYTEKKKNGLFKDEQEMSDEKTRISELNYKLNEICYKYLNDPAFLDKLNRRDRPFAEHRADEAKRKVFDYGMLDTTVQRKPVGDVQIRRIEDIEKMTDAEINEEYKTVIDKLSQDSKNLDSKTARDLNQYADVLQFFFKQKMEEGSSGKKKVEKEETGEREKWNIFEHSITELNEKHYDNEKKKHGEEEAMETMKEDLTLTRKHKDEGTATELLSSKEGLAIAERMKRSGLDPENKDNQSKAIDLIIKVIETFIKGHAKEKFNLDAAVENAVKEGLFEKKVEKPEDLSVEDLDKRIYEIEGILAKHKIPLDHAWTGAMEAFVSNYCDIMNTMVVKEALAESGINIKPAEEIEKISKDDIDNEHKKVSLALMHIKAKEVKTGTHTSWSSKTKSDLSKYEATLEKASQAAGDKAEKNIRGIEIKPDEDIRKMKVNEIDEEYENVKSKLAELDALNRDKDFPEAEFKILQDYRNNLSKIRDEVILSIIPINDLKSGDVLKTMSEQDLSSELQKIQDKVTKIDKENPEVKNTNEYKRLTEHLATIQYWKDEKAKGEKKEVISGIELQKAEDILKMKTEALKTEMEIVEKELAKLEPEHENYNRLNEYRGLLKENLDRRTEEETGFADNVIFGIKIKTPDELEKMSKEELQKEGDAALSKLEELQKENKYQTVDSAGNVNIIENVTGTEDFKKLNEYLNTTIANIYAKKAGPERKEPAEAREEAPKNVGEVVDKLKKFQWELNEEVAEVERENLDLSNRYMAGEKLSGEETKKAAEVKRLIDLRDKASLNALAAELAASSFEKDPKKRRESIMNISGELESLLKIQKIVLMKQESELNRIILEREKGSVLGNFSKAIKGRIRDAVSGKGENEAEKESGTEDSKEKEFPKTFKITKSFERYGQHFKRGDIMELYDGPSFGVLLRDEKGYHRKGDPDETFTGFTADSIEEASASIGITDFIKEKIPKNKVTEFIKNKSTKLTGEKVIEEKRQDDNKGLNRIIDDVKNPEDLKNLIVVLRDKIEKGDFKETSQSSTEMRRLKNRIAAESEKRGLNYYVTALLGYENDTDPEKDAGIFEALTKDRDLVQKLPNGDLKESMTKIFAKIEELHRSLPKSKSGEKEEAPKKQNLEEKMRSLGKKELERLSSFLSYRMNQGMLRKDDPAMNLLGELKKENQYKQIAELLEKNSESFKDMKAKEMQDVLDVLLGRKEKKTEGNADEKEMEKKIREAFDMETLNSAINIEQLKRAMTDAENKLGETLKSEDMKFAHSKLSYLDTVRKTLGSLNHYLKKEKLEDKDREQLKKELEYKYNRNEIDDIPSPKIQKYFETLYYKAEDILDLKMDLSHYRIGSIPEKVVKQWPEGTVKTMEEALGQDKASSWDIEVNGKVVKILPRKEYIENIATKSQKESQNKEADEKAKIKDIMNGNQVDKIKQAKDLNELKEIIANNKINLSPLSKPGSRAERYTALLQAITDKNSEEEMRNEIDKNAGLDDAPEFFRALKDKLLELGHKKGEGEKKEDSNKGEGGAGNAEKAPEKLKSELRKLSVRDLQTIETVLLMRTQEDPSMDEKKLEEIFNEDGYRSFSNDKIGYAEVRSFKIKEIREMMEDVVKEKREERNSKIEEEIRAVKKINPDQLKAMRDTLEANPKERTIGDIYQGHEHRFRELFTTGSDDSKLKFEDARDVNAEKYLEILEKVEKEK